MKSTLFLEKLQRQFEEDFESQNPELFDVVFDIDGKKLHAHKYRLSSVSTIFKSMLSDRWSSKNEAVSIKDYRFEDFKELLSFIYSGKCSFSDTNIFTILDMAEYYQVPHLKELCDEYLSNMELNLIIVFKVREISNRYSLIKAKEAIADFIIQNFITLIKSNELLNAEKLVIKEIVTIFATKPQTNKRLENVFLCVYEWAENQANLKKQQLSNYENFNMNDAIKAEMQEFLPFFEFKNMESSFLLKFVVRRGFLFTKDKLADILEYSKSNFKVKITNNLGQSIFGILSKENKDTIEFIKTISHSESVNCHNYYIHWNPKRQLPSTPSLLKKRDGVSWHLIYFSDGYIGVKHSSQIAGYHYLLAEMFTETYFEFTQKCKIEVE
uniref:BTB domain-containing protein n=1 Tax=Panagrolaimus davidi TaxID=227884 RepID=A0A914NYY7_9BILA